MPAAVFLTRDASSFVNCQDLVVDGFISGVLLPKRLICHAVNGIRELERPIVKMMSPTALLQ